MGRPSAFRSTGWRLALLNAAVATVVVAVAGGVTFGLVRSGINEQADHALAERVGVSARLWRTVLADTSPLATTRSAVGTPVAGDEAGESASDDLVESGDALLFVFDRTGRLIANPRGVLLDGLPSPAGVTNALAGETDARTLVLGEDSRVRVYTAPVVVDGTVVGVIQAARGQNLIQAEIRAVGVASLLGVALGAVLAVTAGIVLARRAMRPVEAAFRREQMFVADASHELRTPLSLIRANVELIQRLPDASPAEVRDELGAVVAEIDATSRLVDDLLLLARSDGAELPHPGQSVDLGRIARETTQRMGSRAESGGLALRFEGTDGIAVKVSPERLRQVVRIVLDNAIAYTPPGGTVTVSTERRGARGIVTVQDTGIGIAPEDMGHVFDRFYRADRARTHATGGAGLGLSIASAIVDAHGGDIAIESHLARGTTVRVRLPVSQASPAS